MTELDPNIVLKAFATPQLDVGNLLETRAQLKLRNLAQQKAERQEADAQAALARRQQIGAQAATDPTGARQAAIGAGDFELVKSLDSMDEANRKRVTEISRATAPLLMSLKDVPAEQTGQAMMALAPQLLQSGFTQQQVDDVTQQLSDPTTRDAKFSNILNSAMTIEEYTKANEAYTLVPGAGRFVGGKLIAERPFAPRAVTVGEGQTVVEYQPGGGSGGGSSGGQFTGGWTPRSRNGGDNSDAAVDGKIAGMVQHLGIDPTQPFPAGMTDRQIAEALTLSEGGPGSLADRNNNPGNLTDPKTGKFRVFPTKEAGLQAAANQVRINRSRGQNTIQTMVEGRPVGGGGAPVIARGAPKAGWKTLTPQEAAAQGLPPGPVYQQSPTGQVSAVGGTAKAAEGAEGAPQGTKQQQGQTRQKLNGLKALEGQLKRVESAMVALDKGGFSGPLGGLVPGGFDAESAAFDKAVAQLSPLIRQITRVPGEGASSDYESRLMEAAQLSRSDNKAARAEGLAGLKELIGNLRGAYEDFLGITPQASGGWGKAVAQ